MGKGTFIPCSAKAQQAPAQSTGCQVGSESTTWTNLTVIVPSGHFCNQTEAEKPKSSGVCLLWNQRILPGLRHIPSKRSQHAQRHHWSRAGAGKGCQEDTAPRWGGSGSDSSKLPRSDGTTEGQRPAVPTGAAGLILLPALPHPGRKSPGDRNSQGAQNAASVPLILPELSVWGRPPQGKHCPALGQSQTLPQLPAPSCSQGCHHVPGKVTKATTALARAQDHHSIQVPQILPNLPICALASACPKAVTQPCSIHTCNPGSLNAGVWSFNAALVPFSVIFRK